MKTGANGRIVNVSFVDEDKIVPIGTTFHKNDKYYNLVAAKPGGSIITALKTLEEAVDGMVSDLKNSKYSLFKSSITCLDKANTIGVIIMDWAIIIAEGVYKIFIHPNMPDFESSI